MVFQWKPLAFVKADAQMAGEQMEKLEASCGLTPKTLLDANRNPGTPLHEEFEWNDNTAAEKYRETQAAYLIRQITVIDKDSSDSPISVRAFISSTLDGDRTYLKLSRILSDHELREKMLTEAKVDLLAFKAKYDCLVELATVLEKIDEVCV